MAEYIVPLLLAATALAALRKQENAYDILTDGAREGFNMLLTIAPSLVVLLSAVGMLRSSGALEALARFLSPALEFVGIPPETVLLMLVRPISGSAALAVGAELIAAHGRYHELYRAQFYAGEELTEDDEPAEVEETPIEETPTLG